MKRTQIRVMALLLGLSLFLTACGSAVEESTEAVLSGGVSKVLMNAVLPDSGGQRENGGAGFSDGLIDPEAALAFLTGDNRNHVYSPLNISLALAMLAEITEGETRAEVLKLLGVDSIEALREQTASVLRAAYYDNEDGTSLIANSLWLRNDYSGYNMETMRRLANDYAASSFEGDMGSEEYNKMLQGWLDEQTKGLLKEQAESIKLDARTILAIATTLYYKVSWIDQMNEDATREQTFHSPDGDVTVPFMRGGTRGYIRGEHFGATCIPMTDGNNFWLFLPDEGYELKDVAGDETYLRILKGDYDDLMENAQVNFEFPRLDVTEDKDLVEILHELGITKAFDAGASDFSPLYEGEGMPTYVSEVRHAARVKADENGVEAAAFTVMIMKAGAMMNDRIVEFVCDRPFLFAIANDDGLVWFAGSVNQPGK